MKCIRTIAYILVVVGALNWGLVGFFGFDIVGAIFGGMMSAGARVVFALVGLAGVYSVLKCFGCCKSNDSCKTESSCCNKNGCNCNCNCCKKK